MNYSGNKNVFQIELQYWTLMINKDLQLLIDSKLFNYC